MKRTAATVKVREPTPLDADTMLAFDAERWDEIADDDPVDCAALCQSHWRTSIPGIED